ncbi:YcbK family protein [Microvirga antarctica]|uniref:YcbK family protein n=1 Tax=Microvirga antarctica TaxID=2819233 RepID=UPI001B309F11|nr:D-Ala-D-Ala carboxypeptidase family metallohydrolase [Microvirga antarctica]
MRDDDCAPKTHWILVSTLTAALGSFGSPALAESSEHPPASYVSLPEPGSPQELREGDVLQGEATSPRSDAGVIAVRPPVGLHCLPPDLRSVLHAVAARFGPISIESTHRSPGRNRQAGGAPHSLHLACRAVDLRVRARPRGAMAYLRSRREVGGLKIYRTGIIHIDNGARRHW